MYGGGVPSVPAATVAPCRCHAPTTASHHVPSVSPGPHPPVLPPPFATPRCSVPPPLSPPQRPMWTGEGVGVGAAVTWGWGSSPERVPILGSAGMSPRGGLYCAGEDFTLRVVKPGSVVVVRDERLTALIRAGTAARATPVKH